MGKSVYKSVLSSERRSDTDASPSVSSVVHNDTVPCRRSALPQIVRMTQAKRTNLIGAVLVLAILELLILLAVQPAWLFGKDNSGPRAQMAAARYHCQCMESLFEFTFGKPGLTAEERREGVFAWLTDPRHLSPAWKRVANGVENDAGIVFDLQCKDSTVTITAKDRAGTVLCTHTFQAADRERRDIRQIWVDDAMIER
jgi:hypothetical protein